MDHGKLAIRRFAWTALVLVCTCASCRRDTPPPSSAPTDERPNIILITVESLRADHVGCYGYDRQTTPQIDQFAGEATVYGNAHSVTSWTLTSHASIFTGLYPSAHRVILPQDRLADGYSTIAEELSAVGYQCAGIISGPYLRGPFNLNQGFEYYDESVASSSQAAAHRDVTNPRMAAAVTRFFEEKRDKRRPFFLFLYYWDVHYDYIPPPPYDTLFVPTDAQRIDEVQFGPLWALGRDISPAQLRYVVAQYDGEIRCTDDVLGRFFQSLRSAGLWDNTAIILTADHGEQFFEHAYLGHKHDIYAESTHVPLIFKQPRQKTGKRDARLVSLVDLYPTLFELVGCEVPTPTDGVSLLQAEPEKDRAILYELTTTWGLTDRATGERRVDSDEWIGIQTSTHKFVHVLGTSFAQLFDVRNDPADMHALGPAEGGTIAGALQQQLGQRLAELRELARQWDTGSKATLDETELQRLRSLGYLP